MSSQYKKLQKHIHPQPKKVQKRKPSHDYLLLGFTIFTLLMLIMFFPRMDWVNRGMYALLTVSLGLTYATRQGSIPEQYGTLANRASLATMGAAVILFFVSLAEAFLK